jgi:hypothetical protein
MHGHRKKLKPPISYAYAHLLCMYSMKQEARKKNIETMKRSEILKNK